MNVNISDVSVFTGQSGARIAYLIISRVCYFIVLASSPCSISKRDAAEEVIIHAGVRLENCSMHIIIHDFQTGAYKVLELFIDLSRNHIRVIGEAVSFCPDAIIFALHSFTD